MGIAKNTYDVIKAIVNDEIISISASVLLNGQYGLSEICLGVPVKIDKKGISVQEIKLESNEINDLHKSSEIIKKYI